jgi:hypothetical protein
MTRRLHLAGHSRWALLGLLTAVVALGACRREPPPTEAKAPGDPVAAVESLAEALRDNDLVRWSTLSLPPDLHARAEQAWVRRQQLAEPPSAEDAEEYRKVMARLSAPDAEKALMRDLEPKLRKFEGEVAGQWPLMQATMTIFLNAAIQANTELSEVQKAHGAELADNLLDWLQPTLFTDRERARKAVAILAGTARELDLPTLEQARALPMRPALEKGGVALEGIKGVAKVYGLDLDRSLDGMTAELVATEGDTATVKVSYPLLDRTHSFEMAMVRRDGGWYSAEAVRDAEADLADLEAEPASTAPAAPADAAD